MTHCGNTKSEVRVGVQGHHGTIGSEVRATKTPGTHGHRQNWNVGTQWGQGPQGGESELGYKDPTGRGSEVRDGEPRVTGSELGLG